MAKKTASNAIKKVDDQIKNLESGSKKKTTATVKTSPVKKSSTKSSTTTRKTTTRAKKDTVIVAPAKKSRTTKTTKTTTTKNVRGGVVTPKRTVTKTIEKAKIKSDLKELEKVKDQVEVVVDREKKKKELAEEVNKILEIDSSEERSTPIKTPKFIQEEKPKEEKTTKKEEKLKDFFFVEDQDTSSSQNLSLDDVDVIKFDKPEEKPKTKKSQLKKKDKSESKDLKLDKPIDLDQIDKIEEYKVVEDFKQDIPARKKEETKKQDFSRKKKGKGYIVHIRKKPTFQELESDLRNLYDKVNDVVGDIDENIDREDTTIPKKKTKKKFVLPFFKKKVQKEKTVVKTKKVKVKPVVEETIPGEKPSLLDHISQRVLNVFLTILFVIFFIMVIGFIAFVIYVSTF